MRILYDPAPTEGGGTETPPTPETKPVSAPTVDPALMQEIATLRSQVRELTAQDAERKATEQKAEDERRRKAGEFDQILKDRDEKAAAAERKATEATERARSYARNEALAKALSSHNLREGSADDLMELWSKEFTAEPVGDSWRVIAKDGRSVADVIGERLKSDRYANHLKAEGRSGGGGQQGGGNAAPTGNQGPKEGTYDFFVKGIRERMKPFQGHPLGDGKARTGFN